MQKETLEELQRKIDTQNQEFEEKLEAERETRRKELEEMKELYTVCESENIVIFEMYDIYYVNFVLCSCVFYDEENQWNRPTVYN